MSKLQVVSPLPVILYYFTLSYHARAMANVPMIFSLKKMDAPGSNPGASIFFREKQLLQNFRFESPGHSCRG